jgi:hypothetical protein
MANIRGDSGAVKQVDYEVRADQMVLRIGGKLIAPSVWKYEAPLFRESDPETSKQAAEKAKEFRARHIAKIWTCLKDNGPMIPAQIARTTGLDYHAVQRRQAQMREDGLIERAGEVIHGQHVLRAKS